MENQRQREVIRQLSVPVLPIDATTLVMPLVGTLDSARLQTVQQQALHSIERQRRAGCCSISRGCRSSMTRLRRG
ncbi:MAG: hypothetical protein U0Z44_22015 [Kouleothrix sp.]